MTAHCDIVAAKGMVVVYQDSYVADPPQNFTSGVTGFTSSGQRVWSLSLAALEGGYSTFLPEGIYTLPDSGNVLLELDRHLYPGEMTLLVLLDSSNGNVLWWSETSASFFYYPRDAVEGGFMFSCGGNATSSNLTFLTFP